nr:hypothetical protein [Bradyrhizobium liaoningense]
MLELNVGNEKAQTWKELAQLSTGQKATAVLLLLLLESDTPLIVDQPEDDLPVHCGLHRPDDAGREEEAAVHLLDA